MAQRNRFDVDESLEQTKFDLACFRRALGYVKPYWPRMVVALLISFVSVLMALITPWLMGIALDEVIHSGGTDYGKLCWIGAGMLLSILGSCGLTMLQNLIMVKVGQSIVYDLRRDVFVHLQALPFDYYDSRPHGKILTRVIQYVNNVSDMLSSGIITFITDIFNLVFIAVFMLALNWKLALLVIAGLPVLGAFIFLLKKRIRRGTQTASSKLSNLNAYLNESIDGVSVTQYFCREDENAGIYQRLSNDYRRAWMSWIYPTKLLENSVDVVSNGILCLVYVAGIAVSFFSASFGTIYALSQYSTRFWQPITSLSNIYNSLMNTIAYLERIFQLLDEPVVISDSPEAKPLPSVQGEVEFRDVTFAYEPGRNILEHFDFHVRPGESIALVGPTGAGKTTIVNLISRFYDLQDGRITIDGHSISDVTLRSLRSQMGIMMQDGYIFSGTVADNIRYGKPDATMEEIRAAAKTVCADDFIMELEHGYDTVISENGDLLSGGQKQLINFARTLISDPKILILDEATSSIDTRTERLVQEGLQHMLSGRTSFIIAHRLSTIKHCDRICYVSNKGIAESGTHDELMAKKGLYYRLCTAQLSIPEDK